MNLNINKQTNLSIQYTSVVIVNVEFNHVVLDSSVNMLLNKLKVAYGEFDRYLKLQMPGSEMKGKAIEINSLLETLMKSIKEINRDERDDFIGNYIKSSVAIIDNYKEAEKIEPIISILKEELQLECDRFYQEYFARYLNDKFWWDLQLYEWLDKEGMIYKDTRLFSMTRNRSNRKSHFSDEQLECFFNENRKEILNFILESDKNNYKIDMENPLSKEGYELYLETYKVLPSAI